MNPHDNDMMTDEDYQAMEDAQFNSSVWEDWEAKVEAEIKRDHALSDIEAEGY